MLQGLGLGTLLFIIFINDIDEGVRVVCQKFADDTKGGMVVESAFDAEVMQQEIKSMEEWAAKWRMEFNVDKCKIVHVGGSNQGFKYEMAGQEIAETDLEKDLGVLVSQNLKPSEKCAKAAKKANAI